MIDANSCDLAFPHQIAEELARRFEYLGNLDADSGEGIHIEEPPVVDLRSAARQYASRYG